MVRLNTHAVTMQSKNIKDLHKAVREGELEKVKCLLHQQPNLLDAKITRFRETALHVAILEGHVKVVAELVRLTTPHSLIKMTGHGETSLTLAAAGGIMRVAKLLVAKNIDLLGMENLFGNIPVVVAAQFGHKEMVHFLYYMSREKDLINPKSSKHGAKLLTVCMANEVNDIALDMVKTYPELCIAVLKDSAGEALNSLARNSAFRSASHATARQSYSWGRLLQSAQGSCNILVERLTHWNCANYLTFIKQMHKARLENAQARELLACICNQMLTLPEQRRVLILRQPVLTSVLHGNVGFVAEVAKTNPDLLWVDKIDGRNLFSFTVSERQEEVFCFIRRMGAMQRRLVAMVDDDGMNILHHAAESPPIRVLGRISGAALQMQRELQWFKEVEKIAPMFKEAVDKEGKTPREIFTKNHEELVTEGQKWMKETATACTVVAALIVTMMFGAALTVPGGYYNTGIPTYLHLDSFIIFIVADGVSLFFSSISVLVFLVILTSLYREEDFLISLPTKLMLGLSTLSFSITSMMVTFGTALVMMLQERFLWIFLPIVMLASAPVVLFVLMHLPVLVKIYRSTYGADIFDR